jgi:hypothetical protein
MAARVMGPQPVEWMRIAERVEKTLPEWIVANYQFRPDHLARRRGFPGRWGNRRMAEEVRRFLHEGRIKQLDIIDHTGTARAAADEFHCPVCFRREQRDILEHPQAYRMLCLTTNPIHNGHPMQDRARQRRDEFKFTYSYFRGQTIYHGGLLARHDTRTSIFFAGDSFTPSGIDDYCLLNPEFFGDGEGVS